MVIMFQPSGLMRRVPGISLGPCKPVFLSSSLRTGLVIALKLHFSRVTGRGLANCLGPCKVTAPSGFLHSTLVIGLIPSFR